MRVIAWSLRTIFLGALVITCLNVKAHEEDAFEMDDFIDPRDLGVTLRQGKQAGSAGEFRFFDANVGKIWNYQDRATFTDSNPGFFSLGYHKYWSNRQLNIRFSSFEEFDQTPRYRVKAEFGRYLIRELSKESDGDSESIAVVRNKISLVIDDRQGRGAEAELSASIFLLLEIPIVRVPLTGGLSASYRRSNSENVYRVIWKSRFDFITLINKTNTRKININSTIWVGYEKSPAGSRFIPFRGKLELDYRASPRNSFQVFYAPAYQTSAGDFPSADNHEFGITFRHLFGSTTKRGW